jgi:ubiquinone/menaquinone biosynthesis C-methylase UbiE
MHMSFTGERYVPELRGQIYYEHFHRYATVLELARDKDILDIACGEGYGTAALALVARTAVGVDLDPESVRHASARYMAMNVGFRTGDCTQIPAGDASFDLAVSFETIEHLTEQERMLGELRRVLRPNGMLVISSPNKLVYSDGRSTQNPFHQRELYFHEFRDMLRSFFPKVRIFGQRVFAASAVHPLRGAADETRWLGPSTVAEATLGALPDPEYFVAICGRADSDELPDLCSVYLDPRDELLADIRSGGLGAALNGGQTALEAPVRAGVLTSGEHQIDDEADARPAALEAALEKVERELTERVHQVKSLEDHAAGLESSLDTEQQRTSELVARLEILTAELAQEREALSGLESSLDAEKQRTSELVTSLADLTTKLAQERDVTSRLEMQRQHENQLLATRIAELAQERDAVSRLETERQRENESLAGRLAESERERDALSRLEAEQQRENQSLAARVAELEQDGYQADERRLAFESLTSERDQLEAAVEQMRRRSVEMLDERIRIERHAAGVTLERDSLRDALAEQQRRSADDLRSAEDKLLTERGNLDFELEREREENRQLRNRVAELARVASQQAAERDLVNVAMDKGLAGAEEARRETERLIAQLNLERLNYDELAQRAHQAESLLAEVLGSTSWRVTLPARRLMGALRGRDKR